MTDRRTLLKTAVGAAAALNLSQVSAPALAQGSAARTLRFVPQGNLASMDPIWGTSVLSRNAGLMVYDTLFASVRTSRSSRRWPRRMRYPQTG